MVDEATILQQRPIVWMSQDADLCICENKTAHQIVLQISLDRDPERFLHQTTPGFARNVVGIKAPPEFLLCNQWLEHRVPYLPGKNARKIVKRLHLLELRFAPGEL